MAKGHRRKIPIFSNILFVVLILGLCCHTGDSRPPFACDAGDGMTRNYPFCSVSLHIRDRVHDLLGRLTLPEKIRLLVNNAAPVARLGIKGYEWWSEALHGVAVSPGVHFSGQFPGATSFPQVITTVASFNSSLWEEIGRAVSDEGRAMYNGGVAGLSFWSPNVNVFRDPRWGRGQETPGEDPSVAARYAAAYVRGLQSQVGNKLKVAACCKHYTAYDLDKWNNYNRFTFNAKVSQQDLEDTYNVPFKACILEGRVASVMCSYNQVNGKPTCADPDLLRGTIRGKWGLDGYIVSDCDSVDTFYNQQHYTSTPEDAVVAALKAGLDLDCGPFLAIFTQHAVESGKLSEGLVDAALKNTLTVQMRLGMFDGPRQPYGNLGPKDVCSPAHQELALEAAQQGIVLLQNLFQTLPLSPTRHRTIAVIGPNSDATKTMIGNYAGIACRYISPLQGIARYAKTVHQEGCRGVECQDNDLFEAAEVAARHADATVLVMGLDQSIEAEAKDRLTLLLPGLQKELVTRVAKASRGPTILVLMSGSPIDVSFAKFDPRISAILWAGYPGQAGGAAIADIIFGAHNPGAKLPMTWYPEDYVHKVPMTDMNMRPDSSRGYPGRTYRFYKGPVVFPFGHGLSYSSFKVAIAQAPTSLFVQLKAQHSNSTSSLMGQAVKVSHTKCEPMALGVHMSVRNVGQMDGAHTVMVFSVPPAGAGKWAPQKQLVAFEKVHVLAGAQQGIRVEINACKHFSVVDEYGISRIPMGVHSLQIGDLEHSISLQLQSVGLDEIKS